MRQQSTCPYDAAIGLGLFALLLFYFQSTTMAKCCALPPTMSYDGVLEYAGQLRARAGLGWIDGLRLALLLLVALVLVASEWRRHRLSHFLSWALRREGRALALVGLGSLVCARFYLTPGEFNWGGDASFHLTFAGLAAETLAKGEWPIWTNAFGAGSPYLQFYGFLFYYLTGLLQYLCPDLNTAAKWALALSHAASGVGMYCLVRSLSRSRRAGLVGGLAYVLCFWHTQQVAVMGRLPLGLFYALLPWPFFCFERSRRSTRPYSAVAAGSLALGSMVFTHPGYGMWATILLLVYAVLRFATSADRRGPWAFRGLALVGLGLIFSAYLTVPMWLERDLTGLGEGVDLSGTPDPTWHHLLVWSNYRFWLLPLAGAAHHWHGAYLGLSLIGLAGAGCWLCRPGASRRPAALACRATGACLALTLLMVFGYRWPWFGDLPLLHVFNASRYLLFTTFFLAATAGLGTKLLLDWRRQGRRSPALLMLLLATVLADLGPATFQHPCLNTANDPLGYDPDLYREYRRLGAAELDQDRLPGYRIFWALGETHPFLGLGWLYRQGGTPLAQGMRQGELPAVGHQIEPLTQYLSAVLGEVEPAELSALPEYPFIEQILATLNVRYLLFTRDDRRLAWPKQTFAATPVLVSGRAVGLPRDQLLRTWSSPEVERLLQTHFPDPALHALAQRVFPTWWMMGQMKVDLAGRTCERLLLLDWVGPEDLGTSPQVELLDHQVWHQRATLRLRLDAPAYVRLAYAHHPYLAVEVDGRPVAPLQTIDHYLALRLEAGEHQISLFPFLSPLRRWLLLLDGLLLAAAVWVWYRRR